MEFIYKNELLKEFNVYGHFYNIQIKGTIFKCRSLLKIISKKIKSDNNRIPDTLVVMMNPGSSKPANPEYIPNTLKIHELLDKEIIETDPDPTQYQLMRVMLQQNWEHITVINLSDLRNGNSGEFSKELACLHEKGKNYPHSIFHRKREKELSSIELGSNTKIVFAWGDNRSLTEEALLSMKYFKKYNPFYLEHKSGHPFVSHASPLSKEQKLLWLKNILKKINK